MPIGFSILDTMLRGECLPSRIKSDADLALTVYFSLLALDIKSLLWLLMSTLAPGPVFRTHFCSLWYEF